jgi:predicted nuclease of restriction endonuclease-like RecB superfamily
MAKQRSAKQSGKTKRTIRDLTAPKKADKAVRGGTYMAAPLAAYETQAKIANQQLRTATKEEQTVLKVGLLY